MDRKLAIQKLRDRLDELGKNDWKVRLYADMYRPFCGMTDYRSKTVTLNSHHVDTHPDVEIINTINHECAHVMVGAIHGHDDVWANKARELGCDNTLPCASYSLSPSAIDAIRSGAGLEVEYTEETQVIRRMQYKTTKFVDKCKVCDKQAKIKSRVRVKTRNGYKDVITLECLHVRIVNSDSQSPFEQITFDGISTCQHKWDKTVCLLCNAKRLYPFQIIGAQSLERANGRLAIFDEMGLGKTIQALAYLRYHPEQRPFLWITKSGIKFQHGKEIIRILGKQDMPQVLQGGKDVLIDGMNVVASYDIFRRLDRKMFLDHGFKSVILDECQAIKNPDSQRTGEIRQIVRDIPSIIPLSGTPWKNRGSEFFVVLNMLDPARFNSYEGFKRVWVGSYWDSGREKEGGINNPSKFKEFISNIAIRRERTEVLPELPLINRTRILCEVDKVARALYNEAEDKLLGILKDAAIDGTENKFETQSAIQQSIMVMRQIVGIAKVPTTVEFVEEFLEDTDRKIVIFVHHKKCGEMILSQLKDYCAENRYREPLKLTADMDSAARFATQEQFNSKSGYRVLVASTLASGEGLNLQTCSDCIMHERQWNPSNEEQAEGRFIRIGQMAQSVNATYIHGDNTVDTIFDGIVERKRIQFNAVMNKEGYKNEWNESSIMNEVLAAIRARRK
jgi:hypothetical protein